MNIFIYHGVIINTYDIFVLRDFLSCFYSVGQAASHKMLSGQITSPKGDCNHLSRQRLMARYRTGQGGLISSATTLSTPHDILLRRSGPQVAKLAIEAPFRFHT